jgi:hypothetical protein
VDIGDVDAKVENHPQNLLKTREIGDTWCYGIPHACTSLFVQNEKYPKCAR